MGLIKGLIFDFDGLILDTEEPSYNAWSQLYADHGLELDITAWANGLGSSEAAFNPVAHLQGMLNHTVDEAMLRNTARIITDQAILEQPPLPGVVPTLEAARQAGPQIGGSLQFTARLGDRSPETSGVMQLFQLRRLHGRCAAG